MRSRLLFVFVAASLAASLIGPAQARAQDNPAGDPVVQKIYDQGMHHSQLERLAQTLMDSIGPR
ncbi:MAG: peptidase M28, partial [Gemmatimonadaceae bacterium]